MSMDATAVEAIQESHVMQAVTSALEEVKQSFPILPLPDKIKIENIEKFFPNRRAQRGAFVTESIADFVKFCTKTQTNNAACFVDAKPMSAAAIFNYKSAGHCDFRAHLALKPTPELMAYSNAVSDKLWSQLDLAHFLEERSEMVQAFTGTMDDPQFVALTRAISSIRKVTIEAGTKSTTTAEDFKSSRSTLESIAANNDPTESLPSILKFDFVPYLGLRNRPFMARVVARFDHKDPMFVLKPIRFDAIKQEMADEFSELLQGKLDGVIEDVYVGTFDPK